MARSGLPKVERAAEECGQRRCEARIGSGGKVMMQRVLASRHFEDKLHPILRKLKLIQPGMGMHAFRRGRISHLVSPTMRAVPESRGIRKREVQSQLTPHQVYRFARQAATTLVLLICAVI
jgi:hypothetical protein